MPAELYQGGIWVILTPGMRAVCFIRLILSGISNMRLVAWRRVDPCDVEPLPGSHNVKGRSVTWIECVHTNFFFLLSDSPFNATPGFQELQGLQAYDMHSGLRSELVLADQALAFLLVQQLDEGTGSLSFVLFQWIGSCSIKRSCVRESRL